MINDELVKRNNAKFEKAGNNAAMAGMALAMMAPAISKMAGAGETATESINGAVTAIGAAGMVFSMMPTKMGGMIAGAIALGAAMHFAAKYLSTKHFEKFSKAAELGKENLERFNASSQAASQAMSDLDAELKKSAPDAKRVMSFQKAYAKALSELSPALRRQILTSATLSDAQEALAKAQMEAIRLQKGRESAAQLSGSMASKTGFTNAYGMFSEDSGFDEAALGATIITGMGTAIGGLIGGIAGFFAGGVGALPGAGVGAAYGTGVGATVAAGLGLNEASKAGEANVFGEGDDSVNLQNFTADVAKSIDFDQLSKDVAGGLDLMSLSGAELATKLEKTYGASHELAQMLEMIGTDDMAVFKQSMQIFAEDAARAREEAEILSNLYEQQAQDMAAVNEAIQENRNRLDSWLQTLTAVTKAREAFRMAEDKASREYWTAAAKSVRDVNKVFLTDEGNAEAASQMKDAAVNNKLLDDLGKIQMKTRDGMIAAVEKTGGEAGLSDQVLLDIRKLQERAVNNGMSNVDMLTELKQIDDGNGKKLGANVALMTEISGLINTQNSEMKIANLTAETQLKINQLQLAAQKKQIQISKDIKTMGGLNTFMDPEGAGKKKAEDFEKGLEGFGVGSARGDAMQQGRGAVQLLRSAMDAGVDIMGPDGAAFKQQAIDANAGFLRNTFTDRANRLNQQADQLDAMGRGGEAQQLRDQASGYMSQAGRADEIAENQVMAEFKKAKMPENIAEIKDIDEKLLKAQEASMKNRQKDFENALNAADITDATTQVANHIAVQTALIKEQKALEEKQEAEAEAKGKEESLKTAEMKIGQDRTHLFAQAMEAEGGKGFFNVDNDTKALFEGVDPGFHDGPEAQSRGMETLVKNIMTGSGGEVTTLRDIAALSPEKIKEFYGKGQEMTGQGNSLSALNNAGLDFDSVFGSGEFIQSILGSQNQATKLYVEELNKMMDAFSQTEILETELADLVTVIATANQALGQAQTDAATAQAVAAATPAEPAIAAPGGPTAGLPTAGGGPALPAGSPTFDSQGRPVAGGAGGAGNTTYDSQGRPAAGGGATPSPEEAPAAENPMADLATNVGSLVERLDQGINAFHNINFETPLPLVVTVQGEVSNLITPEDIAKIENAVIAKLSSSRPQNNGANTAANVNPGQAASTQNL